MSFYVSTATFFLLHCDEWDRVVALPRHKFVTGATLLQLSTIKQTNIKRPLKGKIVSYLMEYEIETVNEVSLWLSYNCAFLLLFKVSFFFQMIFLFFFNVNKKSVTICN